jgi:predicted Zn-dependent protease with MMP-like domain
MEKARFEHLVVEAIKTLPEEFLSRLENIDVVVEETPTRQQLAGVGLPRGRTLLGLYEGVPLTIRSSYYGLVPPDKITIFQKTIEAKSRYESDIITEIGRVVRHEIAHHFGLSDTRLKQLENNKP